MICLILRKFLGLYFLEHLETDGFLIEITGRLEVKLDLFRIEPPPPPRTNELDKMGSGSYPKYDSRIKVRHISKANNERRIAVIT